MSIFYYNIVASEIGWNATHREWIVESYSVRSAAIAHALRLRAEQEPHHLVTYDIREVEVK